MNEDFKYLKELIDLAAETSDEAQIRRFWSLFGVMAKEKVGAFERVHSEAVLSEIHELAMEQYISIQAQGLYSGYPVDLETLKRMISDFARMEHFRRRDDFEGFCLAAYQQIECLTNYLFDNFGIWDRFKIDYDMKFLVRLYGENKGQRFGYSFGTQLVYGASSEERQNNLNKLLKSVPSKIEFIPKFKMVLFYFYFDLTVGSLDEWKDVVNLGTDIYAVRNTIHRGGVNNENQRQKRDRLYKDRYKNYLLFSGYLAEYLMRIKVNLLSSKTIEPREIK